MVWSSGGLIYVKLFVVVFGEVVSVLMLEMLFPDVLNSIQYKWSSFRSRLLFPIQTGPNFCYRFIIYISGVLKFVGASGCEWWFYWGMHGRLPSSCCWWGSVGCSSVHQV